MIPDDIDPSLRTGEPQPERLDDGFSPPAHDAQSQRAAGADPGVPAELSLGTKSPF